MLGMRFKFIDPSLVREFFDYSPETGLLFYRPRDRKHFKSEVSFRYWHSRCSGKEAFVSTDACGYRTGIMSGGPFQAHRVAWAHFHNENPVGQIDHINHDRSDNRILNLRCVPISENVKNKAKYKRNTTGHTGVYLCKKTGKWWAQIRHQKKLHSLGRFENIEDAIQARKLAEERFGFHILHGT
jgi:hypothetical protein